LLDIVTLTLMLFMPRKILTGICVGWTLTNALVAQAPANQSPADWAKRSKLQLEIQETPTAAGFPARLIVTRPADGRSRNTAIIFIPWLSCDAVEVASATDDGYIRFTRDLARLSRAVVIRVEKPGTEGSPGPDCATDGLDEDFAAFRAGIHATFARADVDTSRVFLVGGSIGGAFAVVLAAESQHQFAGVVSVNSFARTWFEHMIDHERRRLMLIGERADSADRTIRRFEQFYDRFLNDSLAPGEVLRQHPELRAVWYDSARGQYGRSARYFQQVQALPIEWALRMLKSPALFISSGYDWVMGTDEASRAAALSSAAGRADVRARVYPKLSHGLHRYHDAMSAFKGLNGHYDPVVAADVASWITRANGTSR
jgi:pimeloyl-ACP methyl ester carboxylesterase